MLVRFVVVALLLAAPAGAGEKRYLNAQLPFHEVKADAQGKVLAWFEPEKNLGWDKVLRLGWDFIEHKVPRDPKTGLKIYLINSVFEPDTLLGKNWQHNPAMLYGSFVDSVVEWYAYSGDREAVAAVREMLDHQLANGTTPTGWAWAKVPFATSCKNEAKYGACLANMPREFYGGIETDKVGELGTGYARFYQLTGEEKYLRAAVDCADALAKHVRAGDAEHTPWPYRVNAKSGETLAREEFGGMIISTVRLFDELLRLKAGDAAAYQRARDMAWGWLMAHPLNRNSKAWDQWSGYFEDVTFDQENVNQTAPTMTAYYLLSRDDPKEWDLAAHLMDWVKQKFGRGPFYGAWGIDEQGKGDGRGCCSRAGLGSDTSRWAAIAAMYAEKTGDGQAREEAFRSLNYSTYYALEDGRISCCGARFGTEFWFSDGYSDYMRHFHWAMGAVPEWAPMGQNHLLRSSSVIRDVEYGARRVRYAAFDPAGKDVLRLNFKPAAVEGGTFTAEALGGGDFVVRVTRAGSKSVVVR